MGMPSLTRLLASLPAADLNQVVALGGSLQVAPDDQWFLCRFLRWCV